MRGKKKMATTETLEYPILQTAEAELAVSEKDPKKLDVSSMSDYELSQASAKGVITSYSIHYTKLYD